MARRRIARETALQMLYQLDLNPDVDYHTVREQIKEQITHEDLAEFAWHLVVGVMEHRVELDHKIQATAQNWSLKRMAPTDRNTLRLGAFELLHTSTPPRVVIDEALELAKLFGSGQSGQFVNGILDRLIPTEKRGNQPPAAIELPPPPAEDAAPSGLGATPASDLPATTPEALPESSDREEHDTDAGSTSG